MRLRTRAVFLLLATTAASPWSLIRAQQPGAPSDGGTTETLQSIYIPPRPNAPFSCTLYTEWVRLLADGSTITLTNHRLIARDAQGRIFQERRLLTPPRSDRPAESPLSLLQYADPLLHTLYNCSAATHLCHLLTLASHDDSAAPEEGNATFAGGSRERIDLGRDYRQGVEVHGTRVVTTINAGVLGNSQPIRIERQFWFADSLGINLSSIRSDPRFGVQNFTVTNLSLDAPDPSLFKLPAGYTVVDDRPVSAR